MPRPDSETLERALALVGKRAVNYEYFFDHLESPDWIADLYERGFFREPPEPEYEGNRVRFPAWPESRYLARMGHSVSELVLSIMFKVPSTDNVQVHQDFADAACTMPPELAAKWAWKEARWVSSQPYLYLLLPEKLAQMVSHLAQGGQVKAALALARALLAVLPDLSQQLEMPIDEGRKCVSSPQPRVRMEKWNYARILKENIPDLVDAAGQEAFNLLCDLLEAAVKLSLRPDEREKSKDHSYIWRPAIEEHEQNQDGELRDMLVASVRDAAEELAETEPLRGSGLVKELEGRHYPVFRRIALHLLRKFPLAAPELVAERLTDRELFDEWELRHEYYLLARDCFGNLQVEEQQTILNWIEEGPPVERMEDTEEIAQRRKRWQRDRLEPLKDHLRGEWRARYEALVREVGRTQHPEFVSYSSGLRVGPTSPITAAELAALRVEDVVSRLRTWQPPAGFMAASPEGMGRVLKTVVASEPSRFATDAARFKGLDPTYVRSFLAGLRDSIEQDKAFSWDAVLDLCSWAIEQPREIAGRGELEDRDPGWTWTRKTIADLLGAGFEKKAAEMPHNLREYAWKVLGPLTDDPEPTPEYEAQYGGSNMDPATISINTVRGQAMHAVVKYALWVRRHLEQESNSEERLARGFDEMPEVREVLERHLNPEQDPSLAIRAVHGQWFPWLNLLDAQWAAANLERIFPRGDDLLALRSTAWTVYVTFCGPYNDVLSVLRNEYVWAIGQIGNLPKQGLSLRSPDERLALHLMTFYGRGKLELDEPGGLLTQFYSRAPDALCGHAVEFIGQSVSKTEGEIDSEVLSRFQMLWERRLGMIVDSANPSSHGEELAAFGWWFASGRFPDEWAMRQLEQVLALAGEAEPDHLVAQRLAALAPEMPLSSVNCLRLMVEGDREGWAVHGWKTDARTVLEAALRSEDQSAREAAEDLVHRLGARGFLEFRDLLQK